MATYQDLNFSHRLFMRAYPFARYAIYPVPCTPLSRPLAQCRVALVTSAGFHLPDQPGFDFSVPGGDSSFREIPNSTAIHTLVESHKSSAFDHTGLTADWNLAFPLDRFRELEATGRIGGLNHRHFSFMGSITKPQSLIEKTSLEVAKLLRADGVEVVLLTPV